MRRTDHGLSAGTVFGFRLFIDESVLKLGPVVALIALAQSSSSLGLVHALTLFPVLLVSVLVHELAHAMCAKSLGVPVSHISLTWFGGYAAFRVRPTRWREAVIAFAGPAANLALAALMFALLATLPASDLARLSGAGELVIAEPGKLTIRAPEPPSILLYTLNLAASINLGLGIFNLLPGLPLDGGHALRAVLSTRILLARAHQIAAWSGVLIGAALVIYAVHTESPWSLIIGLFIGVNAWFQRHAYA
jgi:Zn-dependent protease